MAQRYDRRRKEYRNINRNRNKSIEITPDNEFDKDNIRHYLGFDQEPFKSIVSDKDLYLAFTPKGSDFYRRLYNGNLSENLNNNDAYEFLGDKVFSAICANLILNAENFDISAYNLTRMMSNVGSNRVMTDIMYSKDLCSAVRIYNKYTIEADENDKFHNVCADAFEAIIGVLYKSFAQSYLKNENINSYIENWLCKYTDIPFFMKINSSRFGLKGNYYIINDIEVLIDEWKNLSNSDHFMQFFNNVKNFLQNGGNLGENLQYFNSYANELITTANPSLFSQKAIIILETEKNKSNMKVMFNQVCSLLNIKSKIIVDEITRYSIMLLYFSSSGSIFVSAVSAVSKDLYEKSLQYLYAKGFFVFPPDDLITFSA